MRIDDRRRAALIPEARRAGAARAVSHSRHEKETEETIDFLLLLRQAAGLIAAAAPERCGIEAARSRVVDDPVGDAVVCVARRHHGLTLARASGVFASRRRSQPGAADVDW